MKRRWWIATALAVAVAVLVFVAVSGRRLEPAAVAAITYRPSDPARLATTGRPQLVEFFHHA